MLSEVVEIIKSAWGDTYDDFAFRGDDYIPAHRFRRSWYHGDDEKPFRLAGTSAIMINSPREEDILRAANQASQYGQHLFLLRGTAAPAHEWACDPGEVLMAEHKIVAMVVA